MVVNVNIPKVSNLYPGLNAMRVATQEASKRAVKNVGEVQRVKLFIDKEDNESGFMDFVYMSTSLQHTSLPPLVSKARMHTLEVIFEMPIAMERRGKMVRNDSSHSNI